MSTASNPIIEDKAAIELSPTRAFVSMLILYLLFVSDYMARVGINSILPLVKEDLQLTDLQIGTIGSVVMFGMMAFVMPVAYLADKWSKRGTICLLGSTWSIGSILCGIAPNFGMLLMGRFLVGSGNSGYAPASVATFTSWFPRSKWGTIISIYNTAITVGISGGIAAVGFLASYFSWQVIFFIIGVPSLILSLAALMLPQEKKQANETQAERVTLKEAIKTLLTTKSLLFAAMASAGFNYAAISGINFSVFYFQREMGMDIGEAASIMATVMLTGLISGPLGGTLLDKAYKKDTRARGIVPCIYMVITAIAMGLGYAMGSLALIAIGFFFMSMAPVGYHVITQEVVPAKLKSSSYGVLVLILQLGGALGSFFTGYFSDAFGTVFALVAGCGGFVVSAFFFFLITFTYNKDLAAVHTVKS